MILQLMIKSVYLHHLKTEDPWCNGSTPDFGSVCRGSNPCGSTFKLSELQRVFLF